MNRFSILSSAIVILVASVAGCGKGSSGRPASGGASVTGLESPANLAAQALDSSHIELTWTDRSSTETGFVIERSTGGSAFLEIIRLGTDIVRYVDSGLQAATVYSYRVLSYKGSTVSGASNTVTTQTPSAPTTPPEAPDLLDWTDVSSTQIDLDWYDNSDDEEGFRIERSLPGGSFSVIAVVGEDVTDYQDTGLQPGTTYLYRVQAFNAAGGSAYSETVTAITQGTPVLVPAAPSGLVAQALSSYQVRLTWADNSGNEDGFRIERAGAGGAYAQIAQVAVNIRSFDDGGVQPSTSYTYRVRAFNAAGNSIYSNTASVTTPALPQGLPAPGNLTARGVSSSQIELGWTDNSANEDGFRIERMLTDVDPRLPQAPAAAQQVPPPVPSFVEIARVGAGVVRYTDTGLSAGQGYVYRVCAYNTAGNSAYSNEATGWTQSVALTAPSAPSGLTARAISSSRIDLAWTDNSSNESGFRVERRLSASMTATFAEIALVGPGVTTYASTGLSASTGYEYRVRAYNTAGNSAYSNTASATTSAADLAGTPKDPDLR